MNDLAEGLINAEELLKIKPHAGCYARIRSDVPAICAVAALCCEKPKKGEIWLIKDGKPYCPKHSNAKEII